MSRLLRINDIDVDIDDKTAIGLDLQSYDVKEPGKTFINVSNTFNVPITSNNLSIFGLANDPQSKSTKVYDTSFCNYWIDNDKVIDNAKVRVESIQDRINLFIFEKLDVWEELKKVKYVDFTESFITWMQDNKGLPSVSSPYSGSSQTFVDTYATNTEGLILPMFVGNLFDYDPLGGTAYIEDFTNIYLDYELNQGGHFCAYAKTIFEYIEDTYDVNFLTSGGVLPGNIWDDPVAPLVYIPLRNVAISSTDLGGGNVEIFFDAISLVQSFAPLKDQRDKEDKTLYDLVIAFFQHFNIIKDEIKNGSEQIIRLARFDDLETIADVVNFSGKTSGVSKFMPRLEGYAQQNIIKFKEIYPEGDSLVNSKTLESLNVNLDVSTDLFEIDAYIPAVFSDSTTSNGDILDMTVKESFKTFQFFLSDGETTNNVNVKFKAVLTAIQTLGTRKLQLAAAYDLGSEYNFLDDIIDYPKVYEADMWLTMADIRNFEFFKQRWIQELNGSFFVNKIKGFNPEKSKKPTTLELIKISDKTPPADPNLNNWVDGVQDDWVDGENDFWF
jgi:hypothetical protein